MSPCQRLVTAPRRL